ncbi:Uncharacterised protein [uncultured Comamonas sp.]|nr:Uncharacterised protein [uncultured Comamonas sp.]
MKLHIFSLLFCMGLLACSNENAAPSEKLTLEVATKNAKNSMLPGTEISNVVRENGWQDTSSVNLYKVRYNYELVLTEDLPHAILELAKNYEKEIKGNLETFDTEKIAHLDPRQMSYLQLMLNGREWIDNQKNFPERRDIFLTKCDQCMAYWNSEEGGEDATRLRRFSYMQAWSYFESAGFKDDSKKGDAALWNTTTSFMKTENGWMEAN